MGTRVLLAEDEPLIARSFADLLEAEGYDVDLAPDGVDALDAARRLGDGLDALVTDLRMPRMGGEDLIRMLRSERPGLPVVVVTGSPPLGGEEALRRCAGGDGPVLLLRKPACCGQLAAALRRAVAAGAARPAFADRSEAAAVAPASGTATSADNPTMDHAGSFFSNDVFTFGPGARARASPGATPFRATGDDVLVGGPGEAAWMEVGTANDAHNAGGQEDGGRVAVFFGHRVAARPEDGRDAVWASLDFARPGDVEGLALTGGAREGFGREAPNLLVGNGEDKRVAGPGGGDKKRDGGGPDRRW
jgi:CheY-like chemotaxis protein